MDDGGDHHPRGGIRCDVGRMASAFKTLVRNGAMSIPRWLEEQGFDVVASYEALARRLCHVRAFLF